MYSLPSSMLNSALDYIVKSLALRFRENLARDMNRKYLNGLIFYQMTGIDSRITNPDQRLTQDIDKWAESLSHIYPNFTKPILDIFMFGRKLSEILGVKGPVLIIAWYFVCGLIVKLITPPFGQMIAALQHKEGDFRRFHSNIVKCGEEIAFYRGDNWEKQKANNSLLNITDQLSLIARKRFYMGAIDNFLVKYGAVITSHMILAMPVFGPNSESYLKKIGDDSGNITRDYGKGYRQTCSFI